MWVGIISIFFFVEVVSKLLLYFVFYCLMILDFWFSMIDLLKCNYFWFNFLFLKLFLIYNFLDCFIWKSLVFNGFFG